MNKHNFIIWLKGFVEIVGRSPTPNEWQIIKDHIKLVHDGVSGEPLKPYYLGHDKVFQTSGQISMPPAITC